MRVLIIGGTTFLGPHLVAALQARRHDVTVFNRGRAAAPEGVGRITGDRDADVHLLQGHRFDAVVDTCGYAPRIVRRATETLAPNVGHYVFVSSISVYADLSSGARDEDAPLARIDDPETETIDARTYGALKALCEDAVRDAMPGRCTIMRPGLIVGPLDPTDRFTYWSHRAALGGEMLAPGTPDRHTSFIDVRDVAAFIVTALEHRVHGTFNVSGDTASITMGALIDACVVAVDGGAHPVWVDEDFLREAGVEPWSELPAWLPAREDDMLWASSARAVAAGLTYRALDDTVRATLAFTRERGLQRELKAGLSREREATLLSEWRLRK